MDAQTRKELTRIPGVGPSIAGDLWRLGYRRVRELAGADAQEMYDRLCRMDGVRLDRCLLYVFRCSVYFASEERPEPKLLKWWKWKDAPPGKRRGGLDRQVTGG